MYNFGSFDAFIVKPTILPEICSTISIKMKQVDVMGHNKCNRKCPSTSLFGVLEVEETYGHLISPEPKYSYNVLRTGHTIPQLNSTMDTLEYIWKK